MAVGAGQVDPGLQPLGVGHEAERHLGRQALDGRAGGGAVQAEPPDHQGHHRLAVRAEGPGVGLGRDAAVHGDARQGAVGAGLLQAGDRRLGQGVRRGAHRGAEALAAGHAGAVRQGDQGLAPGRAAFAHEGRVDGAEVLIDVQAAEAEGLRPGRGRLGGRGPLQVGAGRGRAGARIAQDGDEQGGGADDEDPGRARRHRRLLQGGQQAVHGRAPGLRRRAGGGGEGGLALGEHGQGGSNALRTPHRRDAFSRS
ncbi:hypothetical protein D3C77_388530 [compost metagenome]